jgi:RNA polymerase sigma factor (sigma-70 family)
VLAADLTQDIFLKLIENINRYRFTGKFHNYLFTIAVNTCRNHFSKKKFKEEQLEDYLYFDKEERKRDTLVIQEEEQLVQQALDQLNENQKEAILLKYFYDFKVKEIAKIMGTSVPTTQSRIHQGMKKLEGILNRKEFDNVQ